MFHFFSKLIPNIGGIIRVRLFYLSLTFKWVEIKKFDFLKVVTFKILDHRTPRIVSDLYLYNLYYKNAIIVQKGVQ